MHRDWFKFSWEDTHIVTEERRIFARDLSKLLRSFIPQEYLTEKFIDKETADNHFAKHCLANRSGRTSKKTNVYYDFNDIEEYKKYDDELNEKFNDYDVIEINSLYDEDLVKDAFTKLFQGNCYIIFTEDCGFFTTDKPTLLGIHAFANNVTTNYADDTIDFNVLGLDYLTDTAVSISLFPIDRSQLEHTFNNFVEQHCIYKNTKAVQMNK